MLDTRNEDGWSPDVAHDGPAHITVTFAKPIDAARRRIVTVQLNFGHLRNLVGATIEILAMTGTDDGSTLPPDVIAIVESPADERSEAETAAAAQVLRRSRRRDAATARRAGESRRAVAVLTQEVPDDGDGSVADKPRETFILHRGDYSQPTDKVTPARRPCCRRRRRARRRIGWASPSGSRCARIRSRRAWR